MKLLHGEKVLWESKSKNLVITTHRIRSEMGDSSNLRIKSIMLEELDSCSVSKTANNGLVVLGVLCFAIGLLASFMLNQPIGLLVGLIAGVLCFVGYFVSREQHFILASTRETIKKNAQEMRIEEIRQVIDLIEAAKSSRYIR